MEIIDCRSRPDTAEFIQALESPHLLNDFRKLGETPPSKPLTLDECIKKFENDGISRIVCMGRDIATTAGTVTVNNDYVASISRKSRGKIIGIAGIDPLKPGAPDEIRRAVILGLKGISMEPAFMDMYADDRRLYPIYEECAALSMPVFMTTGPRPFGNGTRLCYCDPIHIDNVAADFPGVRLLISHGGYPWGQEMTAIAFRNDNIWMETSAYWFMPGVSALIAEAANTVLGERICFGTAYPFSNVKKTLEKFLNLPIRKDILPRIMSKNILEFLAME